MDGREESAKLLGKVGPSDQALNLVDISLMVMAAIRHLDAIDKDLQKLRKELRTRNGGEDD